MSGIRLVLKMASLPRLLAVTSVALLLPVIAHATGPAGAIRTIDVGSMGEGPTGDALRRHIVERLNRQARLSVVATPSDADATLRGSSSIWATGTFSVNPRSKSYRVTTFHGYLSVELADKAGQTLWSYLVTPSRFRASSITDDLADQAVSRLLDAVANIAAGTPPAVPSGLTAHARLHAAGSTLAAPLYMKWFESAGIPVTYDAIGSEAGIRQLSDGKIDFAATDMPPTEEPSAAHLQVIPTVVGGVVPIYNLPGMDGDLRVSPAIIAGIYSGAISRWNDPRIRAINHGAHLPDQGIAVIHRSDGSGTTFVWTSYLSQVSPGWKESVGAGPRVQWPIGAGAVGNEGMAEKVQNTPYAIGYVELIFAIHHQLNFALVENPAGQFIKADLSSISIAAAGAAESNGQPFRFSILNSPKKDAYPISTFTWLLVPIQGLNAQKKAALADLLNWVLTTGQKQCASLGYVPLPSSVAAKALSTVAAIK
jgi:phosphate transport system substrate-binding protein